MGCALEGTRHIAFVTGAAGMGKATLVGAFLFPTFGVLTVHSQRGKLWSARQYGEEFLRLARHQHEASIRLEAHRLLAGTLTSMGGLAHAREHAEHGMALYDLQRRHAHAFLRLE
jgi:hypothetical protein